MTCSLTLAILLFRGTIHIGILMSFVALWGMTMAFEMPARQSLMVELVGKKDLVNAIALNSAMVNSTRVIGPALGGLLLSGFGPSWCFLLDALSFLAVLYSLYHIKIENPIHNRNSRKDLSYLLEGFHYLKQHPPLARTVSLLFILSLGGWAYLSQLPAFVQNRLGLGADGYGWLLAMNGLGALTAAIVVASQGASIVRERTLYIGIALYSLFVFLFGFQHNPIGAAFMLYCTGFGIILFFSTGNSFLQSNSPDHLRGRLMGIWALVFGGGMPFGSLWMGTAASRIGSGSALQISGIFCLLGALFIYLRSRKTKEG
jgi:predicted MFS family arabinose efflux permease